MLASHRRSGSALGYSSRKSRQRNSRKFETKTRFGVFYLVIRRRLGIEIGALSEQFRADAVEGVNYRMGTAVFFRLTMTLKGLGL